MREEAIYAEADAITVPSRAAARSFVEMGVPAAKLHVIPYGVRLDAFRPAQEGEPGPDPEGFTVLFAGGVGLRKGIPYLLQAFAQVRHPKKRLVLAGAVQNDLRGVLPGLPQDGVEFLGSTERSRLVGLMQTSDVLVLPSIEDGFGLVVPEAMACGCPAICADSAGAADMVEPGVNGFVFPSRDVGALAGYLQSMADDAGLRQGMRAAALASTARMGGWERYGDQWEDLLKGLTAAKA
jgi:glycosyltransferase involved in cell wall biosynthesis